MKNENHPKSLQDCIRYFDSPEVSVEFLAWIRWPDGVECPACQSRKYSYLRSRRIWKCKECSRQFSAKLGTIFEDSPIPLEKWMMAVWLVVNCKNGISSYEIARDLRVTQKSAWFMLHRIRTALQNKSWMMGKIGGPDSTVEVDETLIGGKARNMHRSRAKKYAVSGTHHGKTAVMGMLERDERQIRANVVPNLKREVLQAEVLKNVKHGTRVYTDSAPAYDSLHYRYVHEFVNHMERYVEGEIHTNGLENFWSLLKRTLGGTYVAVEPYHLSRYVDEQVFRYNNRGNKEHKITDYDRFVLALSQISGKRLTYAELTGKVGETTAN